MLNREKLIDFLAKNATLTIDCLPEHEGPEGHFASGDDDLDKQNCVAIYKDLQNGNEWALCIVHITASWRGFSGETYLGGCSYDSEAEFKECVYYDDMVAEAIADLANDIIKTQDELTSLEQRLNNF